ncbi:quinol:cytochrome C oxidoreductase [Aeoliella sp.]|uniref:quinol:cytochrome C oxidoreductase n=1 Tax=Aeoliella sp. TaxID=2795800 RepID=UPI003CCB7F42
MAHTTSLDTWINDTTERRRASPDLKTSFGKLALVGLLVVGALFLWSWSLANSETTEALKKSEAMPRFWHAYLIACCYVSSISLGALFFVIVQYLAAARWGVVLRRLAEIIAMGIGFCGLLFAVIWVFSILAGSGDLYPWAGDSGPLALKNLQEPKQIWLNPPFFIGRQVFYFVVWFGLARMFYRRSVAQDRASDNDVVAPLLWHSGWSMFVFAMTINFASMDWMMTLNPTWFSTIFGVYYFAGCAVAFFALLAVLISRLQARDILTHTITTEHRHDIGKLLFGFVFFWGYIAFSQFLLIWYASIPEEVQWYAVRHIDPTMTGIGWATGLLFLFHLIIPFLGLLSRHVRRSKPALTFWGVYMLIMHWFDLYYIIAPEKQLNEWRYDLPTIVTYGGVMLGVGCMYVGVLLYIAAGNWLVPVRDPRLAASLSFQNH